MIWTSEPGQKNLHNLQSFVPNKDIDQTSKLISVISFAGHMNSISIISCPHKTCHTVGMCRVTRDLSGCKCM